MDGRSIVGVITAMLVAGQAHAQTRTTAPATAFEHVAVIPMDRERVLHDQTVVVRGDRIVALGPAARTRVPRGAVRVDGHGKFLMPGLGDMHIHICCQSDRRFVSEGADPPASVGHPAPAEADSFYSNGFFAALASGVTTVREMHGGWKDSELLAVRQRVAAGGLLGPRIYTAGDLYDGFHVRPWLIDSLPLDSIAPRVAALKAAGHDFVKLYGWPRPIYDSVVAAAKRVGLRVVGHVPYADTSAGVARVLRDRWASVEHLYGYVSYGFGLSANVDAEIEGPWTTSAATAAALERAGHRLDSARVREIARATRDAGVWNCPTALIVNWEGKSGSFRAQMLRALRDAGAGLLLGTDNFLTPSQAPMYSVHLELAYLVKSGLTSYEALATSTRNVAEFLGTLDSTGTVEVGKRADLVLLDGDPLADVGNVERVAGVMAAGRWISAADIAAWRATWSPKVVQARREWESRQRKFIDALRP